MASATLSRGNTTIEIPLEREGGDLLVASSFGKPEVQIRSSGGTLNPRANDRWSGVHNIELEGTLFDYQTSHDLADLIKSASEQPLTLDIPSSLYPDTLAVAPSAGADTALTLTYPAGKRDQVDVSLSLTRVGDVQGTGTQQATTPTASGNGPVQLSVGATTIDLPSADLSVERGVGRPNDTVRRVPNQPDPRYLSKQKVTTDVFTLSFQSVENFSTVLNELTDATFREQLGRNGVTLDFNGLLGLGAVQAIPTGSSPFRQVQQAGRGWAVVPTLELRRIFDSNG